MHCSAMVQVAKQGQVNVRPVPSSLLEEAELVQKFLRGVLMPTVPRIDEGGAWDSHLPRVLADRRRKPGAHALKLRADDEDGLARRIAGQHLHRGCDGLAFLQG